MSRNSFTKWSDSKKKPMDEVTAQKVKARDKVCRKIGWASISVAAVGLAVLFAGLFLSQRKKNKELVNQNYSLCEESNKSRKDLDDAKKTISYAYAQCDQLEADLDECNENCAPKPAPKKVVKPAPKKAVKPAPVVSYKPVIVRDTIRDTVHASSVQTAPVAAPTTAPEKRIRVHRTMTAVAVIDLSANGRCSFSGGKKSSSASSTSANNETVVNNNVIADTVNNRIIADTISNVR